MGNQKQKPMTAYNSKNNQQLGVQVTKTDSKIYS